jgi:ubiquinone/menaquinone biosynthesis C-methylase UbiE
MNVNIGCGADPWGDVRIDILRDYWQARGKYTVNMLADAQFLPFKDKCFDEARLHHALEHIQNWRKALRECCRVAKKVSIIIPVYSYIPRLEWNRAIPFFHMLPTLTYLRYMSEISRRSKEHLWQIDINTLVSILKAFGLRNIQIEARYDPIFLLLISGRKGRYFRKYLDRFKISREWKVIASN